MYPARATPGSRPAAVPLARRGARRVASVVARASSGSSGSGSSSDERPSAGRTTTTKPPPSVIVGGYFVADAPSGARADVDARRPPRVPRSPPPAPDDAAAARRKALERSSLADEAVVMFLASAILGPLLDHQHSRFDILHYHEPLIIDVRAAITSRLWGPDATPPPDVAEWMVRARAAVPDAVADVFSAAFARETGTLETAWWVPLLFGTAGIIIGLGHTLGDTLRLKIGAKDPNAKDPNAKDPNAKDPNAASPDALVTFVDACPGRPAFGWEPAPSVVGACIALFAVQYASSGVLATTVDPAFPGAPRYAVDAALAASGVGAWGVFDGTRQGLVVAVATAVAGPLTEIFLINVTHLYHYENPDVFGIPSWITWVYFCGSPAVGNLSRAVRARRRRALGLRTPTCEVAVATPKKAWRPPPRGNQRGERRGATAVEQPARGKMTVLATAENSGAALSTSPTNRATSPTNRDSSDESRDDATTNASATDDAVANAASKRATPSPDLHPTPSTRDRVASARRDLEWMRSLRREVRELQALKARLEALRARAADAAPPILPMIERRLEERVPEKYRDRLETFEDAFEREVLPRLPEGVRRRVGSRTEREGAKEARRDALRGVAGALEEVREDLTVLSAKLEELREREVGNDEETSDDAEETSGDAEETSDDADVDEK